MENCCARGQERGLDQCPGCGRAGREVGRITPMALLRPRALARLEPGPYRFCAVGDCPIVYFGTGEPFRCEDLLVPVFQKEREGFRTVCYCFDLSEDQVVREVEGSRTSASAERIRRLVQAERCACEVRNPQGTCCLGNVSAVARRLLAAQGAPSSR